MGALQLNINHHHCMHILSIFYWIEVGHLLESFIFRSVQQEEALHCIQYALKRRGGQPARVRILPESKFIYFYLIIATFLQIAGEGLSNQNRWIIGENLVNAIRGALIANPSSKSSPIDRRTSRRREEDDPPGDESPPPESVPDAMKSLLLLRGPEDEAP
ncbi:unnamed protein product [Spirodela intermedia]|uniref:Uncharacterized protein n=1 Tax=Spirodela intermedia TaxID=51605 RepID=A0A7I8JET6_SPIIN|nr:unnamed protein product [Spirodela intermedia]CAA6668629.1 unnamed protein product [Spirodela intermedia]